MRCPWCKEIHGPQEQCPSPNQEQLDLEYDDLASWLNDKNPFTEGTRT